MVTPVSITNTFNGDITASNYVNAAQLDTQLGNLATTINAEIAERQRTVRDGSGLASQVVRFPALHPEVTALLTSGGLIPKQAAAVVSTANVGTLSGLLTIDGYTLLANDRVLLTGQASPVNNGLWVAAAGAWTRPSDSANNAVLSIYTFVSILYGTSQAGSSWFLSAEATVSLTVQTWVIYSVGGILPIVRGGTGASDAATARTNLGLGTIATLNSISQSNLAADVQYRVDTIAALKALTTTYAVVLVRGYYATGDGGGDLFYWDSASAVTPDGVRAFQLNSGGVGRYVRIYKSSLTLGQCGCVGDGVADDYTQFQAGVQYMFDLNGGTLLGTPGKTYKLSNGPTVKTGVKIDLQGCTVNLAFPNLSDYVGFDMRDHTVLTNGTVNVVELGPPTSADKSLHAAVVVGQSGGNYAGYTDVNIHNLVITTNRGGTLGGRGILVQTDSNNVKISNIYFPSSAFLGSAIELHVAGNAVPTLTGHPHNIDVRNITLGTMTKSGTSFDIAAIDIVGCYNVVVDNVDCDAWAGDAIIQIRTGGYGSSLAGAAVLPLFMKDITVSNVTGRSTTQSFCVINGQASIEAGTPIYSIPCIVRNCKGTGIGASCTNFGIRAIKVYDCIFDNCEMQQFDRGCYIEEATRRITVRNSRFFKNNETGVLISHGTAPEDILIDSCESYLNGQDGTNKAGFEVDTSTRITFKDCTAGDYTSETTQFYGFLIQAASTLTHFRGINRVRNIKGGGTKYQFLSACYGDRQFCGGTNAVMNNAANAYAPICGVGASAAEVDSTVISGSAKLLLTNMRATLSAAPTGATKTFDIRILVAGASTALEIIMTDLVVSGVDYDAVEVAANSTLSIQTLPTNTPTASRGKWSVEVIGIE